MDNNLCVPINATSVPCNENHVNEVKTIEIGHAQYDNVKGIIEEHRATGKPIMFHVGAGDISIASAISMAASKIHLATATMPVPEHGVFPVDAPKIAVPIVNPYHDSEFWQKEIEKDREQAAARAAQKAEIENSLGISPETKKLIAAEFIRLQRLHPKWKPSKLARKAGEKYNVKFTFE